MTNNDDTISRRFDDEVALSAVFKLLSHHRRRVVVQYLDTQNGTTAVSDVVDQIALVEGNHTDKYKEHIFVSLVHNHLPMLAESAIIKYNPDRESVELGTKATDMRPHLTATD